MSSMIKDECKILQDFRFSNPLAATIEGYNCNNFANLLRKVLSITSDYCFPNLRFLSVNFCDVDEETNRIAHAFIMQNADVSGGLASLRVLSFIPVG
jgi:hypothetical protein